jgi:hypothetical protein
VLEKHVDPTTMIEILDELLDVPGDKSFRDTIVLVQSRAIARAAQTPTAKSPALRRSR